MNSKTFYQAVLFGIISILLGLLLSFIFGSLKPELPKECEVWDKYYVMEITLFFVGFILRYILDNKDFVKYLYNI